jgi:small subunit ribosomal protein S9
MDIIHLREPLEVTTAEGRYDISVLVTGGGIKGQAGAVRLGIARALIKADPELRPPLRRQGFLTRDARVKERKKPGLKKARKAPQYTKR